MEKMKNSKFVVMVLVAAFAFGFFARLGGRAVDYFWPDPPIQIEYSVKTDEGPVG